MGSSIDRKTLTWIREGVEETLKSVHHAPDAFLENPDDTSPIEACIAPLHRVSGVVRMVGIEGATMLSQELEYLANALVEQRVKQKKDAAAVMASGMLQLPGYLESLYHGQPDIPLILLPLLNDLRACQDKELLTEGEFFSPDLSIEIPLQVDSDCIVKGDLPAVARKLRPGYLAGLLDFIKGEQISGSLENIILVLSNLKVASSGGKAKQLWWIAFGVAESLREEGLDYSISIKILLGRVDRQIMRVIEHGEGILDDDATDKIIKNLLYYVSQSQSHNDGVAEIKRTFGLDYPESSAIEKARENLYGFNVNLIGSISEQIKEELSSTKDLLDLAMHARAGSTEGMDVVLAKFSTIGNALGMLGMNKPKEMINEQKQFLEPKVSAGATLSDEDLMGIAAALLHVESSLSDLGRSLGSDDNDSLIPSAEYESILQLVAKEALLDMREIKVSLEQFSANTNAPDVLGKIPELMVNISGALRILDFEWQTKLSVAIFNYIKKELIDNQARVNDENLDYLADAIIGLEIFFQSIMEESVSPEIGLNVASESITQLGYPPGDMMLSVSRNVGVSVEYDLPLVESL